MKLKLTSIIPLTVALSTASAAYADKWSDMFPHIKNTGDIPECSYEHVKERLLRTKTYN